ncbi:ferredoxin family protein [Nocardia farcinica]|uniref:4Fe-4S ferredoxin-type domain-containing protein n=2 Tax=Nocardia farcinica TaxID=37329 RepID=Q5YRK0_NOCFA|nr:ferredoxin family protein [Nocardia farcinica]AXK88267.1 ferredoxin family protein [Nocardia farcinica]MBF6141396.1 ferredoxin family protein [Nocardia farcinica]MBF6253298.1 ferredoxin family protein [Nocardia farcinica]MBF6256941.1 ferredoxin family protein [Nocardia farcinica]MBF6261601.1 ferredoxin family protein [Nocardia farcinica]
MIELLRTEDCIGCDKCVDACPTNVFDRTASGIPVIARQSDCQTCFMCEAYCPADALYVAPQDTPLADPTAIPADQIGRYREKLGWGRGRRPGSLVALGPELPHGTPPPRLRS